MITEEGNCLKYGETSKPACCGGQQAGFDVIFGNHESSIVFAQAFDLKKFSENLNYIRNQCILKKERRQAGMDKAISNEIE